MRVLLSTIGSRGDVQPLIALAIELRGMGHEARLCAPPDFREWVEGHGFRFFPIGPEVKPTAKHGVMALTASAAPPTPEQIQKMMDGTVAAQFAALPAAAEGCDVIVGANALQIAARSVAEMKKIGYVFAAYCPVTLPSPHHAPPAVMAWKPADPAADNGVLWAEDAQRWNERWGAALNSHRSAAGLSPVTDVRGHILTENPWLAGDPTLGPWIASPGVDVFQTGAWMVSDDRPLSSELEAFLDAGEPPVYFGFGSIRAPQDIAGAAIDAARSLGRRTILSRGWAELELSDTGADCLSIGEVNQQALFPRVAVVVHHGGAGTTHAATRAGAAQVVIPQHYDQPYWAGRVDEMGIGVAHAPGTPTVASLSAALDRALQPDIAEGARSSAPLIRTEGARVAAQALATSFGGAARNATVS